jgi:hypothetical protein
MAGLKLMTRATDPALDIDAVKRQLNIEASDTMFDDEIENDLTPPATELAEKYMARALMSQQWRQYFDCFPGCEHRHVQRICAESPSHWAHHYDRLELWRSPCTSIDAIKYLDLNGNTQTVDSAIYYENTDVEPTVIRLKPQQQWPQALAAENSVWVEFTAGYESLEAIPSLITKGMLLLIEDWFRNRGALKSKDLEEMPFATTACFDMNKVYYA